MGGFRVCGSTTLQRRASGAMKSIRFWAVVISMSGLSSAAQADSIVLLGGAKSCECAAEFQPFSCRPITHRASAIRTVSFVGGASSCCKPQCCAPAPKCCAPAPQCSAPMATCCKPAVKCCQPGDPCCVGCAPQPKSCNPCRVLLSTCYKCPVQVCFCPRKSCPPEVCNPECCNCCPPPPPCHKPEAPKSCCVPQPSCSQPGH